MSPFAKLLHPIIIIVLSIKAFAQDTLIIRNKILYSVVEKDTVQLLEGVEQIGQTYKGITPFVSHSYIGLLDSNFQLMTKPSYHACGSSLNFSDGLIKVSKGSEGVAYMDTAGIEKITLDHICSCCFANEWAGDYHNGYAVSFNGSWHVTNKAGETNTMSEIETDYTVSLEAHYEMVNSKYLGIVLIKTDAGFYGVIENGKVKIPPIYTEINLYQSDSPGIWASCKGGEVVSDYSYYFNR